ncbi:Nicotinamidase [Thermovibrio ammonificans HB-1]|uniref:nicotinamidase n=1 Tax=Thermovibrio ammonificans (strain DSM 15698 / JCM 12110 / HB-1) TaxID=648996 RepID=E8T227_THEA1|nr:nicotinamidase [Thermovibrio ammonificans]ADU96922.1 Nicotinamidase [Thermovibrio ammonificans HB-1]
MFRLGSRDALIVVDIQNDFMPWGALPVNGADSIIPVVNRYLKLFSEAGLPIFATRDWHPENHVSFKENGGIWPRHCVQWSEGAAFAKGLELPPETFIINKGDRPELEAYSGFQGTLLEQLLRERGVRRVFVCGVATDYCVKNTVLGALNLGYSCVLLADAVKGVAPETTREAVNRMLEAGAVAQTMEDLAP